MSYNLDQEVALAQALIQAPSPSEHEEPAAQVLLAAFEKLGFDQAYIDDAGNAIGMLVCGEGPVIHFNGHIDTVPVGDEAKWPHPPLSGYIDQETERLWGRGACDMKSAVACMAYAATDAKAQGFQGTLMVAGVVQEEIGGLGAWYLANSTSSDVVILGEPSKLKLMLGHRGRVEVHAHVPGKIAHAAKSELGDNALYRTARLLSKLEPLTLPSGGPLGASTLTPTQLTSYPRSKNVVPGEAHIIIDYRSIPGDSDPEILARLQALDPEVTFEIPTRTFKSANGRVVYGKVASREGFLTPGENKRLNLARECLRKTLPEAGVAYDEACWWFATDAPLLAQTQDARKEPALVFGFGPGEEELAHTTQESIPLRHLGVARMAYAQMALSYAQAYRMGEFW